MMFKRSFFIMVFLWAVSVGGALYYFITWAKQPDMQVLNRDTSAILQKGASKQNLNDYVLNQLPQLFSKEPALAAVFVGDSKDNLLGSMYDKNRLEEKKYNILQTRFSDVIELGLGGNHKLVKLSSSKNNLNIYLVFKRQLSYAEIYNKIYQNRNDWFNWLAIYIIFGAFMSFIGLLSLLFGAGKNKEKKKDKVQTQDISENKQKISSASQNTFVENAKVRWQQDSPLEEIFPSEDQLTQVMKHLMNKSGCGRITFYMLENSKWSGVSMLTGSLLTRGSELKILPNILFEYNIHTRNNDQEEVQNIFVNNERKEALSLVRHHSSVVGAFHFQFGSRYIGTIHKRQLERLTQEFSRSVSVHRTFEKAVLDEDMGLYTYPYFFFSVKEKTEVGGKFHTLIMRVSGYSMLDKVIWDRWNRFRASFFKTELNYAPICAWLENDRILLNLDEQKFRDKEHLLDVSRRFISKTKNISGCKVHAALVQGGQSQYKIDLFVQTLTQALQKAEVTGDFIVASQEKVSPLA